MRLRLHADWEQAAQLAALGSCGKRCSRGCRHQLLMGEDPARDIIGILRLWWHADWKQAVQQLGQGAGKRQAGSREAHS